MLCEIHGVEMDTIPAGVSKKTGKPYAAFQSHTLPNGSKCNGKAARAAQPQYSGHGAVSGSSPQQRAWGKSKQMQIRLQGLIQAMIASGKVEFNSTDHTNLIKTAAILSHQIEEFADKKVGFDRAADQLGGFQLGGFPNEQVEDIPF